LSFDTAFHALRVLARRLMGPSDFARFLMVTGRGGLLDPSGKAHGLRSDLASHPPVQIDPEMVQEVGT
jgi:hypothetical protein